MKKSPNQLVEYLKDYFERMSEMPSRIEMKKVLKLSSTKELDKLLNSLEDQGIIRRNFLTKSIEFVESESQKADLVQIGVLGKIAAGRPIEAIVDEDNTILLPTTLADKRDIFALKVEGDSMVDAFIVDGDIVVCERSETAANGEIVVALFVDNTATLKTYFKEKDRIRLQPMNDKYPPIYTKRVQIQGKVVAIIRKY